MSNSDFLPSNERFTVLPTAAEYALFREAYAETYPVRPLLNAIDAKDAEIARLRSEILNARRGGRLPEAFWLAEESCDV